MTIFGKSLAEYVRFCRLFFILIPILGIVRLALSLSGTPNSTDKWLSVTAAVWLGVIYNAIRVHTRGFGAYKQLLVICALLNCIGQLVISCGILLAIFTGTPNIYSAPEYAPGGNGASWFHLGLHLIIGTTAGSLVPWAMGSLVLFITRKIASPNARNVARPWTA